MYREVYRPFSRVYRALKLISRQLYMNSRAQSPSCIKRQIPLRPKKLGWSADSVLHAGPATFLLTAASHDQQTKTTITTPADSSKYLPPVKQPRKQEKKQKRRVPSYIVHHPSHNPAPTPKACGKCLGIFTLSKTKILQREVTDVTVHTVPPWRPGHAVTTADVRT